MRLLVQEADLPRVAHVLTDEWQETLTREGLPPVTPQARSEEGEPPCPACGTAAALVDGACVECGLQLA